MWLCVGLTGCFSSPPPANSGGSTSGDGSSSSGVVISAGLTTSVNPSSSTTTPGAESSSSSDSSTSSGSSESSGEPEGCPGDGVCFPPAPKGWVGPAIVLMGQEEGQEPMCPQGADVLWRAGTDPAAPCDCSECGGEIGCQVGLGYGAFGSCDSYTTAPGCQPFSSVDTGQFFTSFSISLPAGEACVSPEPGEPVFREQAVGCAPDPMPCEDGVCLLGPACISRPGEHACPPGYNDRSVLYNSANGIDLSCDSCDCGDSNSGLFCTGATLRLYDVDDCAGAPIGAPDPMADGDACTGYPGIVLIEDIVSVDIDIPAADCSSDRDFENASGEIVESGARTVCCSG